QSHLDGTTYHLTPEGAMDVQIALGSDIIMALDDCLAYPATIETATASMRRSMEWAARCHSYFRQRAPEGQELFGIVQGGVFPELRKESAERLQALGFPGYAIG